MNSSTANGRFKERAVSATARFASTFPEPLPADFAATLPRVTQNGWLGCARNGWLDAPAPARPAVSLAGRSASSWLRSRRRRPPRPAPPPELRSQHTGLLKPPLVIRLSNPRFKRGVLVRVRSPGTWNQHTRSCKTRLRCEVPGVGEGDQPEAIRAIMSEGSPHLLHGL